YWNDTRLKWKPSEYGNISEIRVLAQDLWTPNIFLYFATGQVQEFGKDIPGSLKLGARLNNNGLVFFSQPTTIHASCEVDITNYPFDDQFCKLAFGTWSQDLSQVEMRLLETGVDQSMYVKHNEWEIVSVGASKHVVSDSSSNVGYSKVVLQLHLRRHALFYMVNYILPSIVIAVLSMLVFLIPPEVGKRMEAGINLLLCLSVYLMLINSKMPITSKSFPLLTKFYGCTIVILVISLCCSCWVYSFYFVNPSGWDVHQMPDSLQVVLFDYLQPMLSWSPCRKKVSKIKPSSQETIETGLKIFAMEERDDVIQTDAAVHNERHEEPNEKPLTEEMVTVKERSESLDNSSKNQTEEIQALCPSSTQDKGKKTTTSAKMKKCAITVQRIAQKDELKSNEHDDQDHGDVNGNVNTCGKCSQ
ncbi:hypothetical protein QZH41_013572, partial [Actinostola sp. cb2023]